MSDTVLQTSEASVIPSQANVILNEDSVIPSQASVILSQASVIPSQASVILSEAKDLPPSEAPTDTLELDLALEDELIIEDFTIDGICGVY